MTQNIKQIQKICYMSIFIFINRRAGARAQEQKRIFRRAEGVRAEVPWNERTRWSFNFK